MGDGLPTSVVSSGVWILGVQECAFWSASDLRLVNFAFPFSKFSHPPHLR